MGDGAKLSVIAEKLKLNNYTPKINLEEHEVTMADVNRPALQLMGFFDHFEAGRIQLIGMVEWSYLQSEQSKEERLSSFGEHAEGCRDYRPETIG